MTGRCPITYQDLEPGEGRYSRRGLRLLSPALSSLQDLEYSAREQREEAMARATKMSIQGVQPKLSARLSPSAGRFKIVDQGGTYILKPQVEPFRSVPENEDVTMRMAAAVGIEVPVHGMVFSRDGSLTYFIKRFDRVGRGKKRSVEDFAQLAGEKRATKYGYTMERLIPLLEYTTFPRVERLELFRRTLFSFLVGNEDMHLKNWSVISEPLELPGRGNVSLTQYRVRLAPAYDLFNTTIALPAATEEIALALRGKKNKLTREDFLEYFARQRLALTDASIDDILGSLAGALPLWRDLIDRSFLAPLLKEKYVELLLERAARLGLGA